MLVCPSCATGHDDGERFCERCGVPLVQAEGEQERIPDSERRERARNAAASPLRYEIDGMEQYKIQNAIEDAGLELGAIYHSHTRSDPVPSQTDINLAFYPEALYVIVGLKDGEPDVRAWNIVDGAVSEAQLEVGP